jgi:tetratricopeptide (TPR) repeat protein
MLVSSIAWAGDVFKTEYDKGVSAFSSGDYAAALTAFEKAYKIKPHPLCLFGMGQAHRKLEHYDAAISAYEKFLASKPAPDLETEVRGYLAALKKAKEAHGLVDEARKLFAAGDFSGAAVKYEAAAAVDPAPSTLYSIGLSYQKAGVRAKAIEYYERFLKTDTDPKLRAEAEDALKALRGEPDPVGTLGTPAGSGTAGAGATSGALAPPEHVDDAEAPPAKKSNALLFAGIGGGAAVVIGVTVLVVVLATGGPKIPDTDLPYMTTSF